MPGHKSHTSTNVSSGRVNRSLFKHPPSLGKVDTTILTFEGNSKGSHSKFRPLSSSVSWSNESRNRTRDCPLDGSFRLFRNSWQRILKSVGTSLGSLWYIRLNWTHSDLRRGLAAVESILVPTKRYIITVPEDCSENPVSEAIFTEKVITTFQ